MIVSNHGIVFLFFENIFKRLETTHLKAIKHGKGQKGKVTISNLSCCACFVASNVTCEPCPSRIVFLRKTYMQPCLALHCQVFDPMIGS
jgi:hypothetical protein